MTTDPKAQPLSTLHRPAFDPSGRVFARRVVTLGDKSYAPGEQLPVDHGIAPRLLRAMWEQYRVDTVPAPKPAKARLAASRDRVTRD